MAILWSFQRGLKESVLIDLNCTEEVVRDAILLCGVLMGLLDSEA
jgi:hypothetical protein